MTARDDARDWESSASDEAEERAEAYLAGLLSDADTRTFERDLARPEVARALARAVLVRDLLADDRSLDVPEGLAERLAAGLPLGRASEVRRADRSSTWQTVFGSLAWAWRGPGLVAAELVPGASASGARTGLSSLRYVLGPLASRRGRP